ncbi:hypothetical protein L1D32_01235 [Shewanella insulae]|uniref:hypothetical protein n=1 Tax=Shewanella insulae TaxID=2681496 RepID=UPI001EFD28D1|nr:hypothetical protein [Shewanella insulae]MCG9736783.1 hypothetical protein [Shewanella insulae]
MEQRPNSQVIQQIKGQNNQIAGRDFIKQLDIHIQGQESSFDHNNPHAIDCPFCGAKTLATSILCRECYSPVKEHFDEQLEEQRQAELKRFREKSEIIFACSISLAGFVFAVIAFFRFDGLMEVLGVGLAMALCLTGMLKLLLNYVIRKLVDRFTR